MSDIRKIINELNKSFGDKTVQFLSELSTMDIQRIPTGSFVLDQITGGGIPRGRVTEIFGAEMSGKSTLALQIIASAQAQSDKFCLLIDSEHAMDMNYVKNLGVDLNRLIFTQPDYGEMALTTISEIVKTNDVDVVVVDSVAALVPKQELEGDMEQSSIALQARMMSKALRMLTSVVNKSNTALIFINQLRKTIGIFSSETVTGGQALKYYASLRLDVRKHSLIKTGDDVIGIEAIVKVVKNKTYPPFQEGMISIIFGKGIDKVQDLITVAMQKDIIQRSGSYFSIPFLNEKFQGMSALRSFFEQNQSAYDLVAQKIRGNI